MHHKLPEFSPLVTEKIVCLPPSPPIICYSANIISRCFGVFGTCGVPPLVSLVATICFCIPGFQSFCVVCNFRPGKNWKKADDRWGVCCWLPRGAGRSCFRPRPWFFPHCYQSVFDRGSAFVTQKLRSVPPVVLGPASCPGNLAAWGRSCSVLGPCHCRLFLSSTVRLRLSVTRTWWGESIYISVFLS